MIGRDYLAANPDLADRLGNSPYKAIRHYLNRGMAEGRSLTAGATPSYGLMPSGMDRSMPDHTHTGLMPGDACCNPRTHAAIL